MGQPLKPDQNARILDLQFDKGNKEHLARHDIGETLVWEIVFGKHQMFLNPSAPGRSGTHQMIGPDGTGCFWTIVMTLVDAQTNLWRPITGWPSTGKEQREWRSN